MSRVKTHVEFMDCQKAFDAVQLTLLNELC